VRDADEQWAQAGRIKRCGQDGSVFMPMTRCHASKCRARNDKEAILRFGRICSPNAKVAGRPPRSKSRNPATSLHQRTYEVDDERRITGNRSMIVVNILGLEKHADGSWKCGADIWNSDIPVAAATSPRAAPRKRNSPNRHTTRGHMADKKNRI